MNEHIIHPETTPILPPSASGTPALACALCKKRMPPVGVRWSAPRLMSITDTRNVTLRCDICPKCFDRLMVATRDLAVPPDHMIVAVREHVALGATRALHLLGSHVHGAWVLIADLTGVPRSE